MTEPASAWRGINGVLWLDLETTGLDPQQDQILEIYAELDVHGQRAVTRAEAAIAIGPKGSERLRGNEYVEKMHNDSGLLRLCYSAGFSLEAVETSIVRALHGCSKLLLAGNSIHFDLGFIRAQMPRLAALLHHGVLDVSSIARFAESLGVPPFLGEPAHRAKADVQRSRLIYDYCMSTLARKV